MIRRTWPYGTKRRGMLREIVTDPAAGPVAQIVVDDHGEGHVLLGCGPDPRAQVGDIGVLEFMRGGPMGGYWRFQTDRKLHRTTL